MRAGGHGAELVQEPARHKSCGGGGSWSVSGVRVFVGRAQCAPHFPKRDAQNLGVM